MNSAVLDGNLHLLDQAMREANFTRDWSDVGSVSYTGDLVAHGNKYPVILKIDDFDLLTLPKIYFKEHPGDATILTPHVLSNLRFCYATDDTTTWSHHDDPIGKITGCIQFAQQVLENIVTGKLTEDITAEFSAYWSGDFLLLDIDDDRTQRLQVSTLHTKDKEIFRYYCISDDLTRTQQLLQPAKLTVQQVQNPACVISLEKPLYPDKHNWPPKTLGEFSDWLKSTDKKVFRQFRQQIITKEFIDAASIIVVFSHQMMQFAVHINLDPMLRRKFRPNEKFRKLLFESDKCRKYEITRYTPVRIDNNYLLTRGHEELPPLAKQKIVLIGCGTIGGYLAHLLVRGGAGSHGGELVLIDSDIVMPGNIGRHIIGIEFLFKPKAEALSEHLLRDMPLATIRPIQKKVQDIDTLKPADLVIDATGDEALSMFLNQWRVAGGMPDVIHTWIEGAGLGARAFLAQSGAACLRCLSDLDNKPRYPLVKQDADPFVPGCGCDDYFIPYPGSLSAQTAGLAVNLAIDWARNNSNLRLRTLRFDYQATIDQRPRNPDKLKGCPVCSTVCG